MKLFEKTNIGTMELKNRIVMAPMATGLANEDGTVSQQLLDYYLRRARGGAGLIVVEVCEIDPVQIISRLRGVLKVCDDKYIAGLSSLASAIKANGAKVSLQLHHPGRQTDSRTTGAQPVAPSPIPSPGLEEPRELTVEEIGILVERFAQGARRAKEAGFDAVELHGAHGYLLCQFLSPASNKRNDRYGGDTQRRARFPLEVIAAVREKVGADFPVIFRLSADEHVDGGLTINETKTIAQMLEEAGVDAISVSAGTGSTMEWSTQPMLLPRGCLVPLATEIKKVVHMPVMVAGRINDPKLAETILQQEKADLIAMGRPLLTDPDLPRKAQEGRYGDVKKCIACNSCMITGVICCLLNPETGKEGEVEPKAERPKDVLILGASPAGLEAARVAQVRGHRVTFWDENKRLGERWAWLIRPYLIEQVKTLKSLGVRLELGKSIDVDSVKQMKPDAVIATTGKTPIIPQIPGIDQDNVLHADDVLDEKVKAGGKVVILGAGNIGCETAELLRRKGSEVTIIGSSRAIAYGLELAARKVMTERLHKHQVKIFTNSEVLRIEGDRVYCRDMESQEHCLQADNVILALGSQPDNTLVESLKGQGFELHTVNYCQRPVDAYKATQEGASVARQI